MNSGVKPGVKSGVKSGPITSGLTRSGPTKSGPAPAPLPTQTKSAAVVPTAVKATSGNLPAGKPTASRTVTRPATPPVRRYTQQQPTTDRYKEIQQALADRGYFRGSVDGMWGAESVDALKQFQREQKIDDDGKISSLALIALGLGPHRNLPPPVASDVPRPEAPAGSADSSSEPEP